MDTVANVITNASIPAMPPCPCDCAAVWIWIANLANIFVFLSVPIAIGLLIYWLDERANQFVTLPLPPPLLQDRHSPPPPPPPSEATSEEHVMIKLAKAASEVPIMIKLAQAPASKDRNTSEQGSTSTLTEISSSVLDSSMIDVQSKETLDIIEESE